MSDVEDLLGVKETTWKYKKKKYTIKPIPFMTMSKVLSILEADVDLFKDPVNGLLRILTKDADKFIKALTLASGIEASILNKLFVDEITTLVEKVVSVNKPNFQSSWEVLKKHLPEDQSSGKTLSNALSGKDTS